MSAISELYDRRAHLYERHWGPVLVPSALQLLDVAADWLPPDGAGATILDVGVGTGRLIRAAGKRWPAAELVGVDPARGMLALAHAATRGLPHLPRLLEGPADAIPLPDASVDLALSSFVLQLVPDRTAALREVRRVLRPGGHLAYVTWLDTDRPFPPAEAFDEAVLDLDVDEDEEPEPFRAGDLPSAKAAANQLRRAGFAAADARAETLEYAWTADTYLDYKLRYDEYALVDTLSRPQRQRLEVFARKRLSSLQPADFTWRAGVVFAWARRP
ncbi:MAG: class I SAM-dependent methyltransferase [Candidatus Limnocylindrales bacterium]